MKRFRFQFSLRTVFIVSLIVAIVCSLIKCEIDTRSNFELARDVVDELLAKVTQKGSTDLFNIWLEEAKTNPTYPVFSREYPSVKDQMRRVTWLNTFHVNSSNNYFTGASFTLLINGGILSPKMDFSRCPWDENPIDAINFEITCHRPWSILSRKTSISIEVHEALNNPLLLDHLKGELDKAGLAYDIKEE